MNSSRLENEVEKTTREVLNNARIEEIDGKTYIAHGIWETRIPLDAFPIMLASSEEYDSSVMKRRVTGRYDIKTTFNFEKGRYIVRTPLSPEDSRILSEYVKEEKSKTDNIYK